MENISKDKIIVRIEPTNGYLSYSWNELNINVMQVAKTHNSSGTIETFYISEQGLFYNQDKKLIANNEDDFLNYLLTVEYDYHAPISENIYRLLKKVAGMRGEKLMFLN